MSVALAATLIQPAAEGPNHATSRSMSDDTMDIDRDAHPLPSQPPLMRSQEDQVAMEIVVEPPSASASTAQDVLKIPGLQVTDDVAPTQQASVVQEPTVSQPQEIETSQDEQSPEVAPLRTNAALFQSTLSLFGLDSLAASVARTDPVTGEKINKMRKSYEGQMKTLGLSGRNKAVKHDEAKGMGLSELATWPQEEWQNQKVMGKDVTKGLSESLKGKLGKAMQMQPGKVPNNEYWEDLLGIEKIKPNDQSAKSSKNAIGNKMNGQLPNGARPQVAAATTANTSQPTEAIRARRTAKKRRYDDGSFEGYGEGYADDDMDPGYSSGESRSTKNSGGHRKRRKTKDYSNSPSEFPSRNNSFTAGPVGISAYGR